MNKISYKKGLITELLKYIHAKTRERGFEDETLQERLLLLMEEVGELAHACRKVSGMYCDKNRKIKNEIGEEFTDVLNMLFAVGIKTGVDLEKEFIKKEKINNKRQYSRKKSVS